MAKDTYGKRRPALRTDSGKIDETMQWRETNCALSRLLATHRRILQKAAALAVEIGSGIDDLTPAMADLCHRTCRHCPEPCCITHTVFFDFRDLLFFHLLEGPIPDRQAATDSREPCPFLGCQGCRLPSRIRPWMCIQYLCPAQRGVLDKRGRKAVAVLQAKIDRIGSRRIRMEAEVVRRIKQRSRLQAVNRNAIL
jgi:hypothetical protein